MLHERRRPKALAVAVWDPKKQEGVLSVENLPALAVNEDYQLWIVDPQYPNPVDGGVFDDVGIGPVPVRQHIDTKTHIVRAGISYKFDWWNLFKRPVVASY